MCHLKVFKFDIHSFVRSEDGITSLRDEDIQRTFASLNINGMISSVNHYPTIQRSQCHVYSLPLTSRRYEYVSNHFPRLVHRCVRIVSLYGDRPFEDEFFIRIEQAFPLIEELTINNKSPQKNKNPQSTRIEYAHLLKLKFQQVHDDYMEFFVRRSKISLRNNVRLFYIFGGVLPRIRQELQGEARTIHFAKHGTYLLKSD